MYGTKAVTESSGSCFSGFVCSCTTSHDSHPVTLQRSQQFRKKKKIQGKYVIASKVIRTQKSKIQTTSYFTSTLYNKVHSHLVKLYLLLKPKSREAKVGVEKQ